MDGAGLVTNVPEEISAPAWAGGALSLCGLVIGAAWKLVQGRISREIAAVWAEHNKLRRTMEDFQKDTAAFREATSAAIARLPDRIWVEQQHELQRQELRRMEERVMAAIERNPAGQHGHRT